MPVPSGHHERCPSILAGMIFQVNVVGACPAAGSQAADLGPSGGISTSTAPGAAAAASGPPGTSFTSTSPGQSYSQSGGRRRRRRLQVTDSVV